MSDKSKLVYICSPYATGDVKENVEKAKEYCKLALKEGFVPVAPHLLYPQFLCDEDEAEREQGLSCGIALLEVCAEVWVFGNQKKSEGMQREIEYARNKKKKVVYMDLKEYILREDALNIPFTCGINDDGLCYVPLRDITRHLRNLPAADVVKVVRCRYCKYWGIERGFKETDPPRLNPQPDGTVYAECVHGPVEIGDSMYTDGDFFCAFGERKS